MVIVRLSILKYSGSFLVIALLTLGCADLKVAKESYKDKNYKLAEENFKELSDRGFPSASKGMGDVSLQKNPTDFQTPLQYYTKAFNDGYLNAAVNIAKIKTQSPLNEDELESIYNALLKAEELGNIDASYQLALIRLYHESSYRDIDRGLQGLNTLADKRYVPAYISLASLYHEGEYLAFSDEKALDYYDKAYSLGDEKVKLKAADIYAQKQEKIYNKDKARSIYKEYSNLGDGYASYQIAKLYEPETQKAVYWYKKSSEQDYLQGRFKYALIRLKGKYEEQNIKEAISEIQNLSKNGFSKASYALGKINDNGVYLEKDSSKAIEYFSKADRQGDIKASIAIADIYAIKSSPLRDDKKAKELYMEKLHLPESRYSLGKFHQERDFLEKAKVEYKAAALSSYNPAILALAKLELELDKKKSLNTIERLSKDEYGPASLYLANLYSNKESDLYQPLKARKIYSTYANKSHTVGMYKFAVFLEQEDGLDKISHMWYERAAAKGLPAAKIRLAHMKRDGEYLAYDINKAIEEYKALGDYSYAKDSLGDLYLSAKHVDFDSEIAISYYKKASELGLANSDMKIASILYNGYGVKENREKAKEIYKKYALKNNSKAAYELAQIYEQENRREDALYWYQVSVEDDYPPAQYKLALLIEKSNMEKSNKLLKKSSDNNYSKAQLVYGENLFYAKNGVNKNQYEGLRTVFKAVRKGETKAIDTALKLISNMDNLDDATRAYHNSKL